MLDLVLVGTGDYYKQILEPSLKKLIKDGHLNLVGIVGLREKVVFSELDKVPYFQRKDGVSLSQLLENLQTENTVVLLGHANGWHFKDTKDLVENGFTVWLEKPYVKDLDEWSQLSALLEKYPTKIVLLEYYLHMKAAPLLLVAGKIRLNSFYIKEGLIEYGDNVTTDKIYDQLSNWLGGVQEVTVELLEGEGAVGVLDHRGVHLSKRAEGGGVILDLGLHALAPIFALNEQVGKLKDFKGKIKKASCIEHQKMCQISFGLNLNEIAETYSELVDLTEKTVPIKVSVGKYTPLNKNQRSIYLKGKNFSIEYDNNNCCLELVTSNGSKKMMAVIHKKPESKYYAVLRAACEITLSNSPFTFDSNKLALEVQKYILQAREKAYTSEFEALYNQGVSNLNIFS